LSTICKKISILEIYLEQKYFCESEISKYLLSI
jgi:hypothetical protein